MYVDVYVCMYMNVCNCMNACMYVYVCMDVCMYVCMYAPHYVWMCVCVSDTLRVCPPTFRDCYARLAGNQACYF